MAERRVLVVDDDADLRFLLRILLDRVGTTRVVAEATNGVEAIEAAREHRPDVIVLDEMMPVMSGTDALPQLRATVPGARIVIYSAAAETSVRAQFGTADAYLPKGGPMEALVAAVNATAA